MSKITISAFIVSAFLLLYSVITALFVEKKQENAENKKAEKLSKMVQRGVSRLFSEPHQQLFIFSVIAAVVFSATSIGVKPAAVFIAGVIIALAIEKIAVKITAALLLRIASEYEKGRKEGISAILASAAVISTLASGLVLLALAIFYGILKDVNLLLPLALGVSAEAAFIKFFSGRLLAEESENLKNISEGANISSRSAEFAENMLLAAGAAMAIGSLTPAGAGGKTAILPLALFVASSLILILNVFAFKFFSQMENIAKKENILLAASSIAMLAASFYAVKILIGPPQLFWPIAIGIVLAFVLEIFRKSANSPWKQALYFGFIYFALAFAFKFDGIYALALAVLGMISVSGAVFANNFAAGFAGIAAESADNFTIKKDIEERMSALSFKKAGQVLDESSLSAAFVLFAMLAYKAGIKSISLEAGRVLFALLAGGLIAAFLHELIKDSAKEIKKKISGQAGVLESGNFKLLFYDVIRIISKKEMAVVFAAIIFPIILAFVLGAHALVAFIAGMMITAFALREAEVISAIKLLLILTIVILPIL